MSHAANTNCNGDAFVETFERHVYVIIALCVIEIGVDNESFIKYILDVRKLPCCGKTSSFSGL